MRKLVARILPLVVLLCLAATLRAELINEEHDGHRGLWLRTQAAQVFVAVQPTFRVLSFSRPGERSLMADRNEPEQGLRLAFMEPEQIKASFDVGNQPAEVLERTERTVRVRLAPAAGLRYEVTLALQSDRPRLTLEYRLENVDVRQRRIACWSVIGFPTNGSIVAPFGKAPKARRRLVLSWWTRWPQPGIRFGRDALVADTTVVIEGNAYKVGIVNDAGWAAFVSQDERALVTRATFDAAAEYPEGGANISFFQSRDADGRTRCEVEQMGSLMQIEPGEAATLTETLDLIELPKQSRDATPDELRARIEERLRGDPGSRVLPFLIAPGVDCVD